MTGTWATGWATGDIVTATEFKKSAGAIYDSTLGGAAATIDVTGISATYAHLMVFLYARGDDAALTSQALMRLNGDSAANYDSQVVQGSAASTLAAETFGDTEATIGLMPAATAGANLFSANQVIIPHYAGSSNNKQIIALSANKAGTSTTNLAAVLGGSGWRSNAAINRITLLPSAGNFAAGTRLTIYAMGA